MASLDDNFGSVAPVISSQPNNRAGPGAVRVAVYAALLSASALMAMPQQAQAQHHSAAGYFRIMARPSLSGAGSSKLGYWNLYGRLMNEGPWGTLALKLDLIPPDKHSNAIWTTVQTQIEGGSFDLADAGGGTLNHFKLTQMYAQAGNVLLKNVVWQVGTLHQYFGELGLYDMRPADLFYDTIGISSEYRHSRFKLLIAAGDAGYKKRGDDYDPILSFGAKLKVTLAKNIEAGVGAQGFYEPQVEGSRRAPLTTPVNDYGDILRRQVIKRWDEDNLEPLTQFPGPSASDSSSYRAVGYLGFGDLGPLRWNSLFIRYELHHPDNFYDEEYLGETYRIYIRDYTDERTSLTIGNEARLTLIENRLDAAWALLYGIDKNADNTVQASEDNRTYYSTVLRLQAYITPTLHVLAEGVFAREYSDNGNLWRLDHDSIFQSQDGLTDANGWEFGDSNLRETLQGKIGLVINPRGRGIYSRPSLRILYGVQHSNTHNAFEGDFSESRDQYNRFIETQTRRLHHMVAIEAEAWF